MICSCCNRNTYGGIIDSLKAANEQIKSAITAGWYVKNGACLCPTCKEQILDLWLEANEEIKVEERPSLSR